MQFPIQRGPGRQSGEFAESMLLQTSKPDETILHVASEPFRSVSSLPPNDHQMRHILRTLFITVVATGTACAIDPSAAPKHDLQVVIDQLNAPQFQVRQEAQEQLNNLEAAQIGQLESHVRTCPSAEAVVRCIDSLEHHFQSDRLAEAQAAWEVLESLHRCDRQIVRDQIAHILTGRWKTRMKFSTAELQKHGVVVVKPESVAAALAVQRKRQMDAKKSPGQARRFIFNSTPPEIVQLFFTSDWTGSHETLKLLQRIPGLQTQDAKAFAAKGARARRLFGGINGNGIPPVGIFLVAGHSLSDNDVAWIKGAFGNYTNERSEVMLGINALGAVAGEGCQINKIVPFGSGDAAGLMSGDIIISVAEQKIASFEDLVDELHNYSPGATVDVQVVRAAFAGNQPIPQKSTLSIPVKLRSWKDYARAIHQAAAEGNGSIRRRVR